MFKLCVFDMDGTFMDSLGDIAAAMNRSLAKLGLKTYPDDAYRNMVGDGMELLCRRAADGADEETIAQLISLYKQDYLLNCCDKTKPYDKMSELVCELRESGIKCAILSNKPHEQVMEIADTILGEGFFDLILGQSKKFPTKPAPESLYYVMERFNAEKGDTVYIGDSNVDIRLGKNAGVYTVGVSWGFRGEAELAAEGADAIVATPDELKAVIFKSGK